jgi:ubiquitin
VKPILLLLGSLVLLLLVFLSGVIITANVIAEPEPHRFANINTPDLWTSQPKEVDPNKQAYERLPNAPQQEAQTASTELPRPVAPASQTASQAVAADAENLPLNSAIDHAMTASVQPSLQASVTSPQPASPVQPIPDPNLAAQPQNSSVNAAQAQFCYARYRSYRVEDNTYQPFDGGPRRQCQAPGAQQVQAALPSPQAPVARDVAAAQLPAASSTRIQPGRVRGEQRDLPPLPPEAIPSDEEWHAVERGADGPHVMQSAAPGGSEAGSHEQWCANRYQSYRMGDNTYQPFDGSPRRSCQSPFG